GVRVPERRDVHPRIERRGEHEPDEDDPRFAYPSEAPGITREHTPCVAHHTSVRIAPVPLRGSDATLTAAPGAGAAYPRSGQPRRAAATAWRRSSGLRLGPNRAATVPSRATRNLVKFQVMRPPSSPDFCDLSQRYSGWACFPLTSILENRRKSTPYSRSQNAP